MTPKERAAMQQALEALEYETSSHKSYNRKPLLSSLEAITALREALAEQAEQEPVAQYEMLTDDEIQMLWVNWDANRTREWYECIEDLVHLVEDYIIQKQTEINPLGYLDESDLRGLAQGNAVWIYPENQGRMVAVYAAPVRTKDLTEYELDELRFQNLNYLDYARAVIAADREKNK